MSAQLQGVMSSVSSGLNTWARSLDVLENNIIVLIALFTLFGVCLYLSISYAISNAKVAELGEYVLQVRELGRLYSATPYDADTFEVLLVDSINELGTHINVITQPYFYSKSIEDILKLFPSYLSVMRFAKYVYDHPDTRNNAIHKALTKRYGKKYKTSPNIYFEVTTPLTSFRTNTYHHSILIDLTKAQYVYKKNRTKVNALLANDKQDHKN